MSSEVDFDVGIVGGGPAGAAAAAYLAMEGVACVVLEKEVFPRFHVGESFVPSSTRVFDEIGFLDTMESAGFLHKVGAAWTAGEDSKVYADRVHYDPDDDSLHPSTLAEIRFDERRQEGVELDHTYHVPRAEFDQLLLLHAHGLGAKVYEGVRVREVDLDDDGVRRIRCAFGRGTGELKVRVVLDASGRRTLLGNQLGLRVLDPVFDQYALHAWFDGYDRDGWEVHTLVHFLPMTNSWVWQIPISDTTTSVGVVTHRQHFARSRASREEFFWRCVGTRPEMAERLRAADQVRPLSEEADYSYAMKRVCGDGWLLIGDAARFVDPIFSSGVSIALNSARFAARDVLAALEKGDTTRRSFRRFEETLRCGTRNWYEFITLYYRLNVLFTSFILDPRYRCDVLQLLQGDVYDEEEPPVLERMRSIVTAVENDPDHVWHDRLGSLTADAFKPAF